ncbi:MAG: saccharopine dehydrogenase NADP-binding domain-containing protein [Candidatus Thermoplasmatota archaeon]
MTITIVGCGAAGSAISEQITRRNNIRHIKFVDSNQKKIKKQINFLKKINNDITYDSICANVNNPKKIEDFLEEEKLVINSASPICNIPLLKASINTNTNYMDLASDPFDYPDTMGTSFDDLLKFNNHLKEKNLIALTNAGFSPGFTDLLCKHIIETNNFDFIEKINIYFGEMINAEKMVVSWSPNVLLLESILPATVYRNNRITSLKLEEGFKKVTFPPPIGDLKLNIFNGHPELKTLPKYLNIPVKKIEIGGGYSFNGLELNDFIVCAIRNSVKKSSNLNGNIFDILANEFEPLNKFIENYECGIIKNEFVTCIIQIKGKKNNKSIEYYGIVEHNIDEIYKNFRSGSVAAYLVSFFPTVVSEKIVLDEINNKGVIASPALKSSGEIIKEIKNMGLNLKETIKSYQTG